MIVSRTSPPLLVAALLLASCPPLRAAEPMSGALGADVVVTAEASPIDAASAGVAVTVIDSEEIARSRATTLLELLRTVPGVATVQSGGPGGVGSLFLRGVNSNQFLLLVDGVKLNSPYFGGADLAALSIVNVDRIEIVRGPFSALYGSEAIGGVVQVFTKRVPSGPFGGEMTLGAGNLSAREGAAQASALVGGVGVTAGFRRATIDGDLPNSAFAVSNFSTALDVPLSPEVRIGAVFRHDTSITGIPFSGADVTPHRQTTSNATTWAVPITWAVSSSTSVEAAFHYAADRPGFSDPDDPWGYTWSSTDARRVGGRAVVTNKSDVNRISAGADWERTLVWNEDAYGVELNDLSTRAWSLFLEDRLTLAGGNVVITAGIRRDDQSAYGAATSPRIAVAWRLLPTLKVRATGGSAFRAPTTGELYYPFSGNPNLQPERSVSFEAGAEWQIAENLVAEGSLFQNSVKDLIQYDFATYSNVNVGRARTMGSELVLRWTSREGFFGGASWTWLQTEDLDTGLQLLRRPRNAASVTAGLRFGDGGSASLTGLFVSQRDDVDAVTYLRVTDPSYVRVDLSAASPRLFKSLAPFIRVTNLLGRNYTEVAGFPSPGRRFLAGLNVSF